MVFEDRRDDFAVNRSVESISGVGVRFPVSGVGFIGLSKKGEVSAIVRERRDGRHHRGVHQVSVSSRPLPNGDKQGGYHGDRGR